MQSAMDASYDPASSTFGQRRKDEMPAPHETSAGALRRSLRRSSSAWYALISSSDRWVAYKWSRRSTCWFMFLGFSLVLCLEALLVIQHQVLLAWNEAAGVVFFLIAALLERVRDSRRMFDVFVVVTVGIYVAECLTFIVHTWSQSAVYPFGYDKDVQSYMQIMFGLRTAVIPWVFIFIQNAVGVRLVVLVRSGILMNIMGAVTLVAWGVHQFNNRVECILASVGFVLLYSFCALYVSFL
jgi:hypothetical protein